MVRHADMALVPARAGGRRTLLAGVSLIGLAATGALLPRAAAAASAPADTPTAYQGPIVNPNWSNPLNWTNGVPGSGSATTVNDGNAVSTDGSNSTDTLQVGPTAGSAVTITDNTVLTVGSAIVNQGVINLSSAGNSTELRTAGGATVTLSGGGTLTLSNSGGNLIRDAANGTGRLVNVDNLIQGAGNIGVGGLGVDNQAAGVISANQPTTLYLSTNGSGASNEGRLQAISGGTLNISQTALTQTGGTILGNGGTVLLSNSSVAGGTLTTTAGGTIASAGSASLSNVTISAGSTFTGSDNTATTLAGTITNNGTLLLNSQGNGTEFRTLGGGTTTLAGGGVVQLSNNSANLIRDAVNGTGTLVNVDNTIRGSGNIGYNALGIVNQAGGTITASQSTPLTLQANGAGVSNAGLLQANGGALNILNTGVTQTSTGVVLATNNSTVSLINSGITGGTLTSTAGGAFATQGGANALTNVTISSGSTFTTSDNSVTTLAGTIVNQGTLALSSAGSSTEFRTQGGASVTLTGGGVVQLSANGSNLIRDAVNGTGMLVNVNNTIQGTGNIGVAALQVDNQAAGVIDANQGGTTLTVQANSAGVSNEGVLRATAGTLNIVNTSVTQTGAGSILANGGTVQLQNSNVTGGTLGNTNGGTLTSVGQNQLANTTITAGSTYGITDNSTTYINGTITNNGTIALNSNGSATELRITPGATTTLTGGGVVSLGSNGANLIRDYNNGTGTLVNVNNTIQGGGQVGVGELGIDNQAAGTITANSSGVTMTLQSNASGVSNEGALRASNGGTLNIVNTSVTQTGAGSILANGGTVQLQNSNVTGGTLGNTNGGTLTSVGQNQLANTTITAGSTYGITDNSTTYINGTITNNGTIALNSNGSGTELRITPGGTTTLTGGGVVSLGSNGANLIRDYNNGTGTLVNVNNTIQGGGQVGVGELGIDNQAAGTITANSSGVTMTLQSNASGVSNEGALRASNGGTLNIVNTSVTQTGAGSILANGGTVQLQYSNVTGGTLGNTNGGTLTSVGQNQLANTTITAGSTYGITDNSTTYINGTITNNGTIALNSNGSATELRITPGGTTTLTGGGVVSLGNNGSNLIRDYNSGTGTLVNVNNTIQGAGQVGVGELAVTNQAAGTISANINGATMQLSTNGGGLTNTGTLLATNGGTLNVTGGALQNYAAGTLTGGTYRADAGSTLNLNTAAITTNAATIVLNGNGSAINTQAGTLESGLTTNAQGGSLQVLGGRSYATTNDIGNSGTIQLAGGTLASNSLTNTATGTITGFGAIAPSNGTPLANAGTVVANGGTLGLSTGIAGAGTLQVNAGSTASLGVAVGGNTVGTLAQNGTLATNGHSVTVSSDYTNASFGTGNSFNKTAGVTGGGPILAAGTTAQAITGAQVSNGTTAAPTLALGDFHTTDAAHATGGTSATFQVANTGTTGPALRGAIQTTGITDARLSGSGVTAANYGPVATGAQTGAYTVSVAPSAAGALVNQSIHVANNFANVGEQTVAITGTGYNYAQASIATAQPVNLGNVRVGDTAGTTLAIGNTAPTGAFTERLDGAAGTTTGNATATGSFAALNAGSTSNAISVGLNTSTAGAKAGSATINFTSNAAGVDSLGNSALAAQTVQVQGNAFRLATGSVATPVSVGNVHVGSVAQTTLAVSNTAAADGFSEKLNAAVSGFNGNVSGTTGVITQLGAGATSTAITAQLDTSTAGAKTGNVGLNFASDGTGTTGHAASANGTGAVTVTGTVYNLASSNTIAAVNFGVLHTGTGTQTRTLGVTNTAPSGAFSEGLDSSFGAYTNNGGTLGVAAAGSITNLAAGSTDSSSLQLSVSTAQAGTVNGTIQVHQASNGTIDGLANTALADQNPGVSGTVQATVTNLAQGQINNGQSIGFGNVRIGSTQAQTLSITNNTPAGAFSESLIASTAANQGAGMTGAATLAGGFGTGTGTGVPSLAPQATDTTHVTVGLNTATAGARSGAATIDFKSDGTSFNGGTVTDLGTQTVGVSGNVYRLANPTLNTPTIALAARVGGTASAGISVTNTSPDGFTEGLKAAVATAPASFTSSGAIANLAAGGTDASSLRVGLNTTTSGTFTGTQTLALTSTGAGTDGAADAALANASVGVTGKVYQAATASVAPSPVAFGTVHVGDVVGSRALTVGNTATGALTDVLRGGFGAVSGPFTGTGSLGAGVAAGGSSTALQIGLNTSAAGVYSGSANLSLVSHDDDLADISAAAGPVGVSATVNNYAISGFGQSGGSGTFSGAANAYTLDFGSVTQGSSLIGQLFAANLATGPADLLAGMFDITGGSGFGLTGFSSFSGLMAGMMDGNLQVSLNTSQAGSFRETIDLMGTGSNASGYSGAVTDTILTLEGTVNASGGGGGGGTPVPEPGTLALLASGIAGLLGVRRMSGRGAKRA